MEVEDLFVVLYTWGGKKGRKQDRDWEICETQGTPDVLAGTPEMAGTAASEFPRVADSATKLKNEVVGKSDRVDETV